eukprot:7384682-Pyramimonas_sp.AAC.1
MFQIGTRQRRQHQVAFHWRPHHATARSSMGGSPCCSGAPMSSAGFNMKHPRGGEPWSQTRSGAPWGQVSHRAE